MITLNILKWLDDAGFGTIDTDLFWESVPIRNGKAKDGIWIVSRGTQISRSNIRIQNFDIYSRFANKLTGDKKLEDILQYMVDNYGEVCTLKAVPPYTSTTYENVRIVPTSSVENVGLDENEKMVRLISGQVRYTRKDN